MTAPLRSLLVGAAVCLASVVVTSGRLDNAAFLKQLDLLANNATLQRLLAEQWPPQERLLKANQFPCQALNASSVTPTSVHSLRPADIRVVGSLGDSLTAGNGISATNIFAVLVQNRGLSWSGGGQGTFETTVTMPNVLKKFNPNLYGYATGDGDEDSSRSYFNVAITGSTSSELESQARKLINRIRGDSKVDFNNDWKVVTILSGNNDLCDVCNDRDKYSADRYRANLIAALNILQAELPRTLVNLVEPINIEIVTELNKGLICSLLHLYLCDCAAFPKNKEAEEELIRIRGEYQEVVREIAASGMFDTRDDFTVVYQPFFKDTYPPDQDGHPDYSFFAPDCFHLSAKAQQAASIALWNNMIEPVPMKKTKWLPGEPVECPTEEQPFIYTNKNSFRQSSAAMTGLEESSTVAVAVLVVAAVVILAVIFFVVRFGRRQNYVPLEQQQV